MSKKKAEMILNALNNNEFQYIQQLKRKPNKKKDNIIKIEESPLKLGGSGSIIVLLKK